jgi:hypothetical protein
MTSNITEIAIADIRIPEGRRAIDPAKVAEIAASITLPGMLSPIGIRRHGDAPVELVWGGHRLAACLRLGMKTIAAIAVDGLAWDQGHRENADLDEFVKMTEIAENLHRFDLTTQERNEQLAVWVAMIEKRGPEPDNRTVVVNFFKSLSEWYADLVDARGLFKEVKLNRGCPMASASHDA